MVISATSISFYRCERGAHADNARPALHAVHVVKASGVCLSRQDSDCGVTDTQHTARYNGAASHHPPISAPGVHARVYQLTARSTTSACKPEPV